MTSRPAQEVGRGRQAQEQAGIRAAEDEARAAAHAKLEDAEAKRRDAASKRTQADRVEELADLEKRKRRLRGLEYKII